MTELTSTQLWHKIQLTDEYKAFKREVRKRDGYVCTDCGCKSSRKNRLHVHHKGPKSQDRYFKDVINPRRAVLLCMLCHIAEHKQMKILDPDYNNH